VLFFAIGFCRWFSPFILQRQGVLMNTFSLKSASALFVATFSMNFMTANAGIIDQRSLDITVLKAFNTGNPIGFDDGAINGNDCQALENHPDYRRVDCTKAVENMIATKFPQIAGPLISYEAPYAYLQDGNWVLNQYRCRALEIQTLSRPEAFANASAIGFYYSRGLGPISIPVDRVVKIGEVVRKDGSIGFIHRFQAAAFCWQGSMSSSGNASYTFRPFMEFQGTDGNTYRNWDAVESDYLVGRSGYGYGVYVPSFDRSGELLK
jgi:hypothetical protein